MMAGSDTTTKRYVYQAPSLYVAFFYILLAAWTLICVAFLGSRFDTWRLANAFQLFMIAFILFYTWYFSVAISYMIEVGDDGSVELTSFRRIITLSVQHIAMVEGPHFAIGFIRFRLEREKAYLFCLVHDDALRRVLSAMRAANPEIHFKRISTVALR